MFRIKVHRDEGEVLLAASDEELVGETLGDGGASFPIEASFYGEESAGSQEVLHHLEACTMANLVGEDVVALAVENGYVDPEAVARVAGVPHAQIARMRER